MNYKVINNRIYAIFKYEKGFIITLGFDLFK